MYEFRELTEKEEKELIDKGQRIIALNAKKGVFAAERKALEDNRSIKISNLNAEIEKNTNAIITIRNVLINGKIFTFDSLADADAKTITDLTQRNYSLEQEKAKIQLEKEVEDKAYNIKYSDIDIAILGLTTEIASMREAKEVI